MPSELKESAEILALSYNVEEKGAHTSVSLLYTM